MLHHFISGVLGEFGTVGALLQPNKTREILSIISVGEGYNGKYPNTLTPEMFIEFHALKFLISFSRKTKAKANTWLALHCRGLVVQKTGPVFHCRGLVLH